MRCRSDRRWRRASIIVGGLADIEKRRVRFIGDADQRIAEDYLRVLRFFRFFAAYGEGEPDRAGLSACIRARPHLGQLSRERVRVELLKLLARDTRCPRLPRWRRPEFDRRASRRAAAGERQQSHQGGNGSWAFEHSRRSGPASGCAGVAIREDADRSARSAAATNDEHRRLGRWRRTGGGIGPRPEAPRARRRPCSIVSVRRIFATVRCSRFRARTRRRTMPAGAN